jgi:uncharacterized protein YggT (Ycf19 family)
MMPDEPMRPIIQHMDRDSKRWVLSAGKILTVVVYAVILSYVIILGTAFFLQLFGANPTADFADWVYRAADRIMEPFRGIFPTTQITDRAVFNGSLLFAIIVYSAFGLALHALIDWFTRRLATLQQPRLQEQYVNLAEGAPPAPSYEPSRAAPPAV